MKKWLWLLLVVLIIFLSLYALTYFFIIPKAAEIAAPFKWKQLKPGLRKTDYAFYLGLPGIDETRPGHDIRTRRDGDYTFRLRILYTKDSIAASMQLDYTFSNYLFYKTGTIYKKDME